MTILGKIYATIKHVWTGFMHSPRASLPLGQIKRLNMETYACTPNLYWHRNCFTHFQPLIIVLSKEFQRKVPLVKPFLGGGGLVNVLRAGRWVTMIWFLFGMRPYHTNTRFRLLFFRMNNCLAHLMLHKEKELPNNSGRLLSYNNFTDKKENGRC